jgi:hypothetical protein
VALARAHSGAGGGGGGGGAASAASTAKLLIALGWRVYISSLVGANMRTVLVDGDARVEEGL